MYKQANLTKRSRIAVRYTTDPAAVGYADTQEQAEQAERSLMDSKPDYIGTAQTALEYVYKTYRRLGINTCIRFDFRVCATGETVNREFLRDLTQHWEYLAELRKRGFASD